MERVQLSVNLREGEGKGGARKVRARGLIPGIIYGQGIKENINVEVNPKEFSKALSGSSGMNTLLEMEVPKHGKVTAMLKDYQADNLTRKFTHVDFVTIGEIFKFGLHEYLAAIQKRLVEVSDAMYATYCASLNTA